MVGKPSRRKFRSREPLITTALLTSAATSLIAVLVSFGLDIPEQQQVAILGAVAVFAPIAVAWAGRHQVWTTASVDKMAEDTLGLAEADRLLTVGPDSEYIADDAMEPDDETVGVLEAEYMVVDASVDSLPVK